MRKALFFVVLILFISGYLFAWGGEYWSINLQSSLDFNFGKKYPNERLYDFEYIDGFNNRPLIELDISFFKGPWTFVSEATILSLRPPIALDINSMFSPMIKLGFIEYDDEFLYASLGRRKQSIGISDFNLFVNKDMPFYDGLNLSIGKEKGFKYDALISVSNLSRLNNPDDHWPSSPFKTDDGDSTKHDNYNLGQHNKYFLFHSFSYVADTWFLMVGESAVFGNPKSIGDLNIFTNIHNENSERANVGMEFQFAKIFNSKAMLYGMFGIDDLPALPQHADPVSLAKTPSALAFGLGTKFHAIKGDVFVFPSNDPDKGIRKNSDFGDMRGGLVLSIDYAATSRWFYIRSEQHHSANHYFAGLQSFYNYFINPEFVSDRDHFSVPFGPKYGGDAQVISVKANYEETRFKINGVFELALIGMEGRSRFTDYDYWGEADISAEEDSLYYSKLWITSGNIKPLINFKIEGEVGIVDWLSGHGGFSFTYAEFLPFKYNINLGLTAKF